MCSNIDQIETREMRKEKEGEEKEKGDSECQRDNVPHIHKWRR